MFSLVYTVYCQKQAPVCALSMQLPHFNQKILDNSLLGEIFVLIQLNLFVAPFDHTGGILNFPISVAIFVMSGVYFLCLFWQVKFQAFEADVFPSLIDACDSVFITGAKITPCIFSSHINSFQLSFKAGCNFHIKNN